MMSMIRRVARGMIESGDILPTASEAVLKGGTQTITGAKTFTAAQTFESAITAFGVVCSSGGDCLTTDLILETTAAAGVTVDGVLLKDAGITASGTVTLTGAVDLSGATTTHKSSETMTNLDLGASGTAGTLDIFPSTASRGKIAVAAADNTGNTVTTITNAAMGQTCTITIPDPGASSGTFALLSTTNAFTGRLTTTDAVSSGTARVVGGRAFSAVSASDNLLASAGGSAHVDHAQTYSIPASTLKANSVIRIKGMVRVTDASGTDTLETKWYLGSTTLATTTAFDPDAADDFVMFEFEGTCRSAPGAAVEITGVFKWATLDGSTLARSEGILAPTNFATNGALVVKVSSKWSSTTASTNARLEMLNVDIT